MLALEYKHMYTITSPGRGGRCARVGARIDHVRSLQSSRNRIGNIARSAKCNAHCNTVFNTHFHTFDNMDFHMLCHTFCNMLCNTH